MTSYTPDDIDTAMNAAWPWISRADQQYGTYRAQMERGLAAAADGIAARARDVALNDVSEWLTNRGYAAADSLHADFLDEFLRARAAEQETHHE